MDANKKVYVYNTSGGLLGSWTAGSLASNATVEGIATNGTDVWIVDAKQDKVFRYTGAASRLSGSQNAASSFSLNSSNTNPKDIVTDGTSLWVVNDSTTDKVFKYTLSGSLLGSWTITGAGSSPTGITLDPTNVSNLWIVDSGTDRVYQFDTAAGRTSGSQSPSTSFALAAGNTNPQGIADPPVPASGASQVATLNKTSHPSGHLAAHLGRTIPGLQASKSTGSFLSQTARPSLSRRPAGDTDPDLLDAFDRPGHHPAGRRPASHRHEAVKVNAHSDQGVGDPSRRTNPTTPMPLRMSHHLQGVLRMSCVTSRIVSGFLLLAAFAPYAAADPIVAGTTLPSGHRHPGHHPAAQHPLQPHRVADPVQ